MKKADPAETAFLAGQRMVALHPLFGRLLHPVRVVRQASTRFQKNYCPPKGWAIVLNSGEIHVHPTRRCAPEEWAYVLAHNLLHLGLSHLTLRERPTEWNAAACACAFRLQEALKIGRAPSELALRPGEVPVRSEEALYQEFCERGIPEKLETLSTGGPGVADLWFATNGDSRVPAGRFGGRRQTWAELFGEALQSAVEATIRNAAGPALGGRPRTPGDEARTWFINHYPLLGALAAAFEIIEEPAVLARLNIEIGAVMPSARRIYLNTKRLAPAETRFVMAHEILHAALQHEERRRGRDAFLWNVACDFVINHWLVEMGVGSLPSAGGLLDPDLKGLSAEAIYDRIVTDLRRYRKHATFRCAALGDILSDAGAPGLIDGTRLDDFYRQALQQGLAYHEEQGRGLLPAGLVDEIRALSQPPIPWEVELGRWLDAWFQPVERGRTFARPSRRQHSTPQIPRPSWVPRYPLETRTFGVLLDTSGSMWWKARGPGLVNVDLLGRALGAIASYAMSRDVPLVRVVFCDALPYDQGYLPAEDLAGRVRVRGQGGTILQPGIRILEEALDFPASAPILIITDGACDVLRVRREHAFLLPEGRSLPFSPMGPIFRVEP